MNKKAERLVKSIPKRKPEKQNGISVRAYYTLAVLFKLT